jgi:hypothetical protein
MPPRGHPTPRPDAGDTIATCRGAGCVHAPSSYPPAWRGGPAHGRGRAVGTRRLRDFVVSALLLLLSLAALVVVATAWGLSLRASMLLALALLVPGLLWLALRP